jgi:hypothetical protein
MGIFYMRIYHLATLPYTLAGFDLTTHRRRHVLRPFANWTIFQCDRIGRNLEKQFYQF